MFQDSPASRYFLKPFEVTGFIGDCLVAESGVVRRMSGSVTAAEDDGAATETEEFAVETSAVGDTSVRRPSWLSTAKENAPVVTSEFTDGNRAVAVTLSDGIDLAGELSLDGYDRSGYYDGEFDGTFAVGDTLYLWKRSNGAAGVTRSPPGDVAGAWESETDFNLRVGDVPLISGREVGAGPQTTRSLLARLLL